MKAVIVSMSAVLALCYLTGMARADDSSQPPQTNQRLQRLMTRFHQADVNGDGKLTREEAQKGMPRVYQHFSQIDTDNQGYVTLQQIAAYVAAHPETQRSRQAPAQ
jgi:Ca2+-binding EF-hand superfamily protein